MAVLDPLNESASDDLHTRSVADQADIVGPDRRPANAMQTRPSKQSREELTRTLKKWWQKDGPHAKKWREGDSFNMGARDAFDFIAMRQWTEEEVDYLKSQRRQPITFNRLLATINAVKGIEINSRHEISFMPRTSDVMSPDGAMKVEANETLSAASQSFADECDAEDEESEAFGDALICGMGFTESNVMYDEDPTGKYLENTLNPLEMAWDYRARKKNLADSQRIWHLRPNMPVYEAQAMFPDASIEDLNCSWAAADTEAGKTRVDDAGLSIDAPMEARDFDPQMEVSLLRVQWWEYEPIWIVAHPGQPDKPQVMTDQEYQMFSTVFTQAKAQAEAQGMVFPPNYKVQAKRGKRKAFFEAYCGQEVLDDPKPPQYGAAPQSEESGFTLHCITGIPDKVKGYWFGLTAVAKDPQKWANAWLSQTQHIVNTTAKGGIIAEEDAFVDPRKAEQDYGRPDSIVFVNSGAIAGNKIMQKPGVGITAGHANLVQLAINSIRDVLGINLEIMGLRDANQPGVLEAQRKQAAMTILAPWFDSLRRYRKQIGRARLYYIQNFLATPGRLIPVAGEDGVKLVPLLKQKIIGKHDVVISDAPTSPNQKMETWSIMQPLLPLFGEELRQSPEAMAIVLKYSPLPSKVSDAFIKLLSKGPSPVQQAQQAVQMEGAKSQIELNKAKVADTQASAQDKVADTALKISQALTAQQQVAQDALQARIETLAREIELIRSLAQIPVPEGAPPVIDANQTAMAAIPQLPMLGQLPVGAGGVQPPPASPQPPMMN